MGACLVSTLSTTPAGMGLCGVLTRWSEVPEGSALPGSAADAAAVADAVAVAVGPSVVH